MDMPRDRFPMQRTLVPIFLIIAGSWAVTPALAQAGFTPSPLMGFFVTSTGPGQGGNLGGLAGADAHCQQLAAAAGAGNRTWRAYLSTSAEGRSPAVDARDRIGLGPWANAMGVVVARNQGELHEIAKTLWELHVIAKSPDNLDQNTITAKTALTEKGVPVAGPVLRNIFTGSQPDGTAYKVGSNLTCNNWRSTEGLVQVGHSDRIGDGPNRTSWNSAEQGPGCAPSNAFSAGLFYCFAQH